MGGGSGEWNAVGSVLPVILFAYGCQIQLIDIFRSVDAGRPRRRGGASGDGDGEGEGDPPTHFERPIPVYLSSTILYGANLFNTALSLVFFVILTTGFTLLSDHLPMYGPLPPSFPVQDDILTTSLLPSITDMDASLF